MRIRARVPRRDRAPPASGRGPTVRVDIAVARGAKGVDGTAGFGGGDVEVSLGEVGDPADVVEVEVGEHNVSNVGRAVAELFDLAGRGFGLQECRPQDMTE